MDYYSFRLSYTSQHDSKDMFEKICVQKSLRIIPRIFLTVNSLSCFTFNISRFFVFSFKRATALRQPLTFKRNLRFLIVGNVYNVHGLIDYPSTLINELADADARRLSEAYRIPKPSKKSSSTPCFVISLLFSYRLRRNVF